MNKQITTHSTSLNTTQVTPIVLRENLYTRLVFHPLLIDENHKNPDAQFRGYFVFQRKGFKDEWQNITGEYLSSLKKGEGFKLELSSEEFLKLIQESSQIIQLYKDNGFSFSERTFSITEDAAGIFLQISDLQNKDWVVENLRKLEKNNFENLHSIMGVAKIITILEEWEKNKLNCEEGYWQKLFEENIWVLQQVFSYPVIILQGETYVGGKNTKGRNGQGGVATDFLGQNQTTSSFGVIEIKTPCAGLTGKMYRGKEDSGTTSQSYSMSDDLTGGLVQLQNQIETAIKNFKTELGEDFNEDKLNHLCPFGVLIIGSLDKLSDAEKKSFFLFRKTIKDVTIITFDELFEKISILKQIFSE